VLRKNIGLAAFMNLATDNPHNESRNERALCRLDVKIIANRTVVNIWDSCVYALFALAKNTKANYILFFEFGLWFCGHLILLKSVVLNCKEG
jgi:hypothetical protein